MVKINPSSSNQNQHRSQSKERKKTIHITIHSINITNANTKKSLHRFSNSISIDNKQRNESKTTSASNRRQTLLQDIIHIDQNQLNLRENSSVSHNIQMNDTRANYMDYKKNEKKKKNKCKRLVILLFILTVIAVLLSVLIISSILLINPKETDKLTTTISATTTSITSYNNSAYPISSYAILNASNFDPTVGTPTQQADGLLDRPNTTNGTPFAAGGSAPQWIQLELPSLYNIISIDLLVIQSPAGITQHNIYVGSNQASLQLVTNLTGYTTQGQWLNTTYNPILTNVKIIKVISVSSPSWIAWQKCVVYSI